MMRVLPVLLSLAVLLVFGMTLVPQSIAQGLFSKGSSKTMSIIRKARRFDLVPVTEAAPGIVVDLRYKVTSASGKPLYLPEMPCLVHKETGNKLKAAQRELVRKGYRLKVWDAWRPPEAHLALWEAVKDPRYVIDPKNGLSWHCLGVAVDVTLIKLDGSPVKMPTKFDVFSKTAASTYQGNDPGIRKNLSALQNAMKNAGFQKIKDEWWHFDDQANFKRMRSVSARDLGIKMPKS